MSRRGEAGPDTPKQRMRKSFCQLLSPSVNSTAGAARSPAHHAGIHSPPSPAPAPAGQGSIPHRGQTQISKYNVSNQTETCVTSWLLAAVRASVFPTEADSPYAARTTPRQQGQC